MREVVLAWRRVGAYAQIFGDPLPLRRVWEWLPWHRLSWPEFLVVWPALQRRWPLPLTERSVLPIWAVQSLTRLLDVLPCIPGIHSVWLTGSVAAGSVRRADIDIFVIAHPERLWLTRALLGGVSWLLGRYRTHDERGVAVGKWCLNLWLEPSRMDLSGQASLYLARECVQALPLYESARGNAAAFLAANSWVAAWLPNGYEAAYWRAQRVSGRRPWLPSLLPTTVMQKLNVLAYRTQQRVMRAHHTREIVGFNHAFFHPRATKTEIYDQYETICTSQDIPPWQELHVS